MENGQKDENNGKGGQWGKKKKRNEKRTEGRKIEMDANVSIQ